MRSGLFLSKLILPTLVCTHMAWSGGPLSDLVYTGFLIWDNKGHAGGGKVLHLFSPKFTKEEQYMWITTMFPEAVGAGHRLNVIIVAEFRVLNSFSYLWPGTLVNPCLTCFTLIWPGLTLQCGMWWVTARGQPVSTPLDNSNSSLTTAQSVREDTSYLWAEEKEAFPSL